jgi:membrane protease YdiL (CAAX protease family)
LPDPSDLTDDLSAPDETSAAATAPARPPFSAYEIFVGREGLRAGWSLLLYAALLLALLYGDGALMNAIGEPLGPPTGLIRPKWLLANEAIPFLCVVIATWIMAKIEGRPNAVYGLNGRRGLRNFLGGLGWGAAMLSLLVFSLHVTGLLAFDGRVLFGRSAFRYGALWFGGFLIVALCEEYLFRGYLQYTLGRGLSGICGWLKIPHCDDLGFWLSAVVLSFGFGLTHQSNAGESPIGLLAAGLIGIVFCLSLWRTGSLWWAIGFHASWDWAQSFVYGVADSGSMVQGHLFATHPIGRPVLSGGLTGPEGSILILPIILLTSAVIVVLLPRTDFNYATGRPSQDRHQPQLHLDLP